MQAIGELRNDHELILATLSRFEAALTAAEREGAFDPATFAAYLAFFRDFAGRCHHAKEEQALFPALIAAGLPARGGPIACMLDEHEQGRARLAAMAEAIDSGALAALADQGRDYVDLLRDHIAKENGVLFMMAEQLLDEVAAQRLAAAFTGLGGALLEQAEAARQACARLATQGSGMT